MSEDCPYVSRGGLKLAGALDAFGTDVTNLACADLGCNIGGFSDCLLQRGAASIIAIDTGYGQLAWTLRKDPRVTVMERTNALHCAPTAMVELVVIDLAWTVQSFAVPAGAAWLAKGGQIISLVKPHYEAAKRDPAYRKRKGGAKTEHLTDEAAADIFRQTCDDLTADGYRVLDSMLSPIRGKGGGVEYLALIEPT
jgi:23S rRNA (cytidine1920-2'-O)/16S rRNA (cytidine1409-2'-O)-methyltransferase